MPSPHHRYRPFPSVELPERHWPGQRITRAPRWVSVDLRDGNQALVEPMGPEKKRRLFDLLVRLGFREIEVGFPAASATDFEFVRELIESRAIPEQVTIQVLVQAREALIERTFEALAGAPRAIVHVYNSTSELQRRVVFGLEKRAVLELAVEGVRMVKSAASCHPATKITLEYSPESFSGTELPFALEVCDAVVEAWAPRPGEPVIINLPATVEMATPNVYADQIEWMHRRLARRSEIVLSVHTHNDRGTAVAASELALLAGAERVEGTLFGNGERTGNADLVTLALNLTSQGLDSELDFSNLPEVVAIAEEVTQMSVPPRQPYAGALVFTAFSGSHQDAISKGLRALERAKTERFEVPYLPIDPGDVGRLYEPLVRINSQSGKGGVAFVLERAAGFRLPREFQVALGGAVQRVTDASGTELGPREVVRCFEDHFLDVPAAFSLGGFEVKHRESQGVELWIRVGDEELEGPGQGPLEALLGALNRRFGTQVECLDFSEHAITTGSDAEAAAYVSLGGPKGRALGAGRARDVLGASLRAVLAAYARLSRSS